MIRNLLTEHIRYQELPLSAINLRYLLAVEKAICMAWERLKRSSARRVLREGNEKDITIELRRELEDIRASGNFPPFTESEFAEPIRGAEFISYDAKHLEKRPDLTIYLRARRPGISSSLSTYDAIFIECKILDESNANMYLYAKNGIARFVEGEYAWAMPHGHIVAYVKGNQILPNSLARHLEKNDEKFALVSAPELCRFSLTEPQVYFTVHSRNWSYPLGGQPGKMKIRHLWLSLADEKSG